MVEQLKDGARVDWSRMACQSVSVRSVGRASALSYPYELRSVACRMGVERGAGGLTSRMRPRRDGGQDAGWRAQPRARD